jgi:hypothetical protein
MGNFWTVFSDTTSYSPVRGCQCHCGPDNTQRFPTFGRPTKINVRLALGRYAVQISVWHAGFTTGAQIFQKPKSYLKIPGVVRVERSKFQTGEPTNNRRHRTKFSRQGDVAPGICAPPGLVLKPSLSFPVLYSLTPFDTVHSYLLAGSLNKLQIQ